MQKKVLKIKDVSGGMNTKSSSSDLEENQAQLLANINVSNKGLMIPLGGFDTDTSTMENIPLLASSTATDIITSKDNNVKAFPTDINRANAISSDLFITTQLEGRMQVAWKSNNYAWESMTDMSSGLSTGTIDGTAWASGLDSSYIDMIQGRGAVRMINSNFATDDIIGPTGSTKMWFGNIKRKFADSEIDLNDYFTLPSDLVTPDSGTVTNGVHNNNFGLTPTPPTQGKFLLEVDEGTSAVTGETGFEVNTPAHKGSLTILDSVFYMTFTYDGNQETLPYKCGPHLSSITGNDAYPGYDGNRAFRLRLNWYPYGMASGTPDEPMQYEVGGPRITHVNIYRNIYSDGDTSTFSKSNFEYITTFNLEKGWETQDGGYNPWSSPASYVVNVNTGFFSSSFTQNFRMRNSFSPTEKSLNCRWKTSTRLRNTLYVGNVYMEDEFGTRTHYPDRMMKSIPNKFDTFPNSMRIDVAVDDGDSIVKLANFAGKILQFKKKTLNIINATKEFEFLEASIKNMGIDYPTAVVDLKAGVAFANSQGLFIYNGKEIVPLIKDKLSSSEWETFYTGTSVSVSIDYINLIYTPSDQNITVQRIAANSSQLIDRFHCFIFNMNTQSFVESTNLLGQGLTMTNKNISPHFNIDNDIYQPYVSYDGSDNVEGIKFSKYKQSASPTSSSGTNSHTQSNNLFSFVSKNYDCGNSSTVKKLKRIQLRYKMVNRNGTNHSSGQQTNLQLKATLFREGIKSLQTLGNLPYYSDYTEINLDYDGTNKNFNTIQVFIASATTSPPDVYIDGIEVVYKEKRLK